MSNYTKSTNFATKDNLPTGDPLKIVKGTEIDTEFNNISTAIATKTDNSAAAITGGTISGITDLAVADGGTGASTAAGALNNLLPSQTSNANKYLQTDGTNATWDAVTLSTADITGTLAIANGGTGTTSTTFVNAATNVTGTLPVANGGTGVTSSTGSGNNVLSTSPTLVTPVLGTPTSATLTNATGLPLSTGITGLGTGVATALAINTPNTGSIVVNGGALGTPSSGVVTNLTGTASININGQVGSSTPNSGNFTTLTTSSTVIIGNGTVDGVLYLDASKNLVSGSVLSFSGVHLTSNRNKDTTYSATDYTTYPNGFILQNSATPATGLFNSIYFKNNGNMQNVFGVVQNSSGYGDFVWAGLAASHTEWMRLASTGLTLTSNPTLSGGTANGITYLNGSKVLTSGSALTFDGTDMGIGGAPVTGLPLRLLRTSGGAEIRYQNTAATWDAGVLSTGDFEIFTGANKTIQFGVNGSGGMRLTSTGLGIGTSSPKKKLTVSEFSSSSTTPGTNPVIWVGGGNVTANTLSEIGFTYGSTSWSESNVPATVGFQLTSTAGFGKGALTFCTRDVTTDTAPTERMRIDSAGNLTLNSGALNVTGGSANPLPSNFSILATSGVAKLYSYWSDNSARGSFEFHVAGGNGSLDLTALTITDGASVKVKNVVSVGDATPASSGAGITFPATDSPSSDANTLDDYEEGAWIPTDQSGASLSLTVYNATYTKVGRLVEIQASITYPSTASTADAQIGGLPFPAAAGNDNTGGICFSATNVNLNITGLIARSNTKFFLETIAGVSVSNLNMSSKVIKFFGWYYV